MLLQVIVIIGNNILKMNSNTNKYPAENTTFLLELYSDEIPARMQVAAEQYFLDSFTKNLQKHYIQYDEIKTFSSPCRIAVQISKISNYTQEHTLSIKGPKVSVNESILSKFCEFNKVNINDLIIQDNVYMLEKVIPQQSTSNILKEIIPGIIDQYVWPKSMYWGSYDVKWVRPLQNILCILGDKVVDFQYKHLRTNNKTYGHKFINKLNIKISNILEYLQSNSNENLIESTSINIKANEYVSTLKNVNVIVDRKERIEIIRKSIDSICKKYNLQTEVSENLLEEIAGLIEYPNVLCGTISDKFLQLPSEVLETAMKVHQKYFCLKDFDDNFSNKFIFVSNLKSTTGSLSNINIDTDIIRGNERVLTARLSDAEYFFLQDKKRTLKSRVDDLSKITFHNKIGNLKDKTYRVVSLCNHIYNDQELSTAALLSKTDLTTEIVSEFPELQGTMGKYYAKICDGLSDVVSNAIEDHYMPKSSADDIPRSSVAIKLSIIDKIDTLTGLFISGEKPTSTKDPYALRRLAISIIRTILGGNVTISLNTLFDLSINEYVVQFPDLHAKDIKQVLLHFLKERLIYFYKKQYNYSYIKAVLHSYVVNDLLAVSQKLKYFTDFIESDEGAKMLALYKRLSKILPANIIDLLIENLDTINTDMKYEDFINIKLIDSCFTSYDYDLYHILNSSKMLEQLKVQNFDQFVRSVKSIMPTIDSLFDNVLVNDENIDAKNNRYFLLGKITYKLLKFARFDMI